MRTYTLNPGQSLLLQRPPPTSLLTMRHTGALKRTPGQLGQLTKDWGLERTEELPLILLGVIMVLGLGCKTS